MQCEELDFNEEAKVKYLQFTNASKRKRRNKLNKTKNKKNIRNAKNELKKTRKTSDKKLYKNISIFLKTFFSST